MKGDDVDQRPGADDDGRVDRVRSRETLERLGEVEDLLRDGSESIACRSSAPGRSESASVWPGPSGTSFAIRSTTPYGMSSTRPAPDAAARAAIVENVIIWATRSRPYLSAT